MSVRFDADTDRVTYAAGNPPDPASGFTVTAWAMVRVDTNANATLTRTYVVVGDSTAFNGATSSDGLGGPNYFTGGGTVTATTGFAVDAWRKVAFTCNATTGHIYVATVGGATEHVSGTVGGAATPTGITLGGRSAADSTEFFNGRLAYVRMWSSQLNQAQVEAEWASTTPVVTAGLWASWPLLVHTDLTDHSGNGRDLLVGATSTTTEADPPLGATVTGVAAAALGAASGVASGTPTVLGVAVSGLGRAVGVAAGTRTVLGVAASTLGGLAGAAAGARVTVGTALAALGGMTATAVGARGSAGVAAALLGQLDAVAAGSGSTPAPVVDSGGSWDSLVAVIEAGRQYAREDAAREPVACPNDGTLLESGPNGELFCRFDGWRQR